MRASWVGTLLSGTILVVSVSLASGGYFRASWLWLTLGLCSLAGIVLLLRERIVLGRLDPLEAAALACFSAWTALSASWSSVPTQSLHDAERGLVYLAALLAFALLVERETVYGLLAGVCLGAVLVSAFSLAQRLFATGPIPADLVSGTRLNEPLGYANGLGALAGMGTVLALGLVAHARSRAERASWCVALPILLPTLTLTQSRGAILALGAGLSVLALLERQRAELLAAMVVLLLPGFAAVLVTLHASALTDAQATAHQVSSSGREVALVIGALMLAAGLASVACDPVSARLRRRRLTWTVPLVFTLALAGVVGVAALGVNRALGPRVDYWRVAWHEFGQHRWLGSGAATFAEYWDRAGVRIAVLDAHSLYVETLAELGIVGLALLVVALVVPLLAARDGFDHPLAAVAIAVYATFLVHAGIDWDWELPAVTLVGILGAVALLVFGRVGRHELEVGPLGRGALGVGVALVAVLAVLARVVVA